MLHKEAQGLWRWAINEESGCGEAVGREEDVRGPETTRETSLCPFIGWDTEQSLTWKNGPVA